MKKLLTLASVLLSLLVVAPVQAADQDPVDPDITSGKAARELSQARDKWLGWGVSNYRMTAHRSCFCTTPFKSTITVRNRKAVKISDRPWYGPRTVPAAFKIINDAIKRKVAVLTVKYDGRLGYPKSISIDYIAMAVDDEISYRITNFKTLK